MYMEATFILFGFVGIYTIAAVIAYAIAEFGDFKSKPFNCRECLTFWLILVTGTSFGAVHGIFLIGLIASAVVGALAYFVITKDINLIE